MSVTVTYKHLSEEQLDRLVLDKNVLKIEQSLDTREASEWIDKRNLDGYTTTYAYQRYCEDTGGDLLTYRQFLRLVKDKGYTAKNVRICDSVGYCFVKL